MPDRGPRRPGCRSAAGSRVPDQPEDRDEHEQRGEYREDPVVRQGGGPVGEVVLLELRGRALENAPPGTFAELAGESRPPSRAKWTCLCRPATRRRRPYAAGYAASASLCHLARARQPLERLVLDAPDASASPSRRPAPRSGVGSSPPTPKRSLMTSRPARQARDRRVHGLLAQADLDLLDRSALLAREQVAEAGVALVDRPGGRGRDGASDLARLLDLVQGQVCGGGDGVRRRAAELQRELALGARDLPLALTDVHRDADRAALVREPALDRLADPEGRVGGELVAAPSIELRRGSGRGCPPGSGRAATAPGPGSAGRAIRRAAGSR